MLPYFLIGDPIFPLKLWLMKAYGGHNLSEEEWVYNYRLARARWTTENAFCILAARWRIFCRPITAAVSTSESIIKAAICLHNYLQGFVDSEDSRGDMRPGERRSISSQGSNRYGFKASDICLKQKSYCNSLEGSVPWQLTYVRSIGTRNRICSFNFTTVRNVYVVLYYIKALLYVRVFDVSVKLISVQKLTRNKEVTKCCNKTKTCCSLHFGNCFFTRTKSC